VQTTLPVSPQIHHFPALINPVPAVF
jgi:hypothetical protein